MTIHEEQTHWITKWLAKQGNSEKFRIQRLAGDGSTRQFFRVFFPKKNLILLWDPDWTLSQDYPSHQTFLKSRKIRVPDFFAIDSKVGALLMEDLGDDLLQHYIQKHPKEKFSSIERSVILLGSLHAQTFPVPKELPCASRFFDKEKYSQEFLFTWEHLGEKLLSLKKPASMDALTEFSKSLEKIQPLCFSHRDYHTRNILATLGDLVLIDFQDARMGPPHYDLASILYDAYLPVTAEERSSLIQVYQEAIKGSSLSQAISWDTFDSDLKRVALQRTIKAAGSFASFYTRYQKTTHLPYLVPALEMAKELRASTTVPGGFDTVFPLEDWIRKSKELKIK